MILSVDSSTLVWFAVISFFILSEFMFGKVLGVSTVKSILSRLLK